MCLQVNLVIVFLSQLPHHTLAGQYTFFLPLSTCWLLKMNPYPSANGIVSAFPCSQTTTLNHIYPHGPPSHHFMFHLLFHFIFQSLNSPKPCNLENCSRFHVPFSLESPQILLNNQQPNLNAGPNLVVPAKIFARPRTATLAKKQSISICTNTSGFRVWGRGCSVEWASQVVCKLQALYEGHVP